MAFDVDALTDYSFAQIKVAAKHAMLSAIFGGANYTINGKSFGRITTDQAQRLYDWAAAMEADEAAEDNGGGIALVQYGERF
jgi:hypothetical protein